MPAAKGRALARSFAGVVAMAVVPMAALAQAVSAAGPDDAGWQLNASQSVRSLHNLLRLADGVPAPTGLSRDDTVARLQLEGRGRLRLGRQRLQVSSRWHDERYHRNPGYDHQAHDLLIGLDWQAAAVASGGLVASRRVGLSPINASGSGLLREQRLERVEDAVASMRLGGTARMRLDVEAGWRQVKPDAEQPALRVRSLEASRASLSVSWHASSGTLFGLGLRHAQGRYGGGFIATPETAFTGQGLDLRASWPATGASRLDLMLGQGRTRWPDATARTFSGPTARLLWAWQATAASRLRLQAETGHGQHRVSPDADVRDPVQSLDDIRREDALRVAFEHRPRPHWALRLGVDLHRRQLARPLDGGSAAQGVERSTVLRLGLSWMPRRVVRLDCGLAHERQRAEGALGSSLQASGLSCTVGVMLDD